MSGKATSPTLSWVNVGHALSLTVGRHDYEDQLESGLIFEENFLG